MDTYGAHLSDGRSADRVPVRVGVQGTDLVVLDEEGTERARRPVADLEPLEEVFPNQPLRLADRRRDDLHLTVPDHGLLSELGRAHPRFRRVRQGRASAWGLVRWALVAVAACVALILALPHLAAMATPLVPHSVERSFGESVRQTLIAQRTVCAGPADDHALQRLAERMGQGGEGRSPGFPVEVRIVAGGPANAFAAPGGEVVFFHELIEKAESGREVAAVLAHEMGHVAERHSMQHILRSTALSMVVASVLGDFSAPAARAVDALANLSYSRDAEREADDWAVATLGAHGYDSRGLVEFFERIGEEHPELDGTMALLSTHPAPGRRAERLRGRVAPGTEPLSDEDLEALRAVCE